MTTSKTETNYPICGFAFALSLTTYSSYPGTTLGEATTVNNNILYTLNAGAEGGQQELLGNDYLPLPTSATPSLNVLKIAQEGAVTVGF